MSMSISTTITAVKAAQIISVPASAFLAGMIGCMSFVGIPAIALAGPDTASKQWKRVYDIGSTTMPPLVVGVAACFSFLAVKSGKLPGLLPLLTFDPTTPRVLYSIAAISLPSIVPYTIAFMKPTNDILMARANSNAKVSSNDVEIPSLLTKWSNLNYVRALVVGSGAIMAATATVLTI